MSRIEGRSPARRRMRRALAVLVATATLAVSGRAPLLGAPSPDRPIFPISGSAGGLFPGAATRLDVVVTNPYGFAIEVRGLSVSVSDARAGCPASLLTVTGVGRSFVLAAHARAVRPYELRLAINAPDACGSASFPLSYSAQGVKGR